MHPYTRIGLSRAHTYAKAHIDFGLGAMKLYSLIDSSHLNTPAFFFIKIHALFPEKVVFV